MASHLHSPNEETSLTERKWLVPGYKASMAGSGGLMLEAQSPQDQQGYLRGLTLLFPASLPLLQQFS